MQLLVFSILFKSSANSKGQIDQEVEGPKETRKSREEISVLLDFLQMMSGHLDFSDQTLQLELLAPVFERLLAEQIFRRLIKPFRLMCIDKNLIELDKRLKLFVESYPLAGQARNPEPRPQPAICELAKERSAETDCRSPEMVLKESKTCSQFCPTTIKTFGSFLTTKDVLSNLNRPTGQ